MRVAALLACLALAPLAGAVDSGQRFEDPAEQSRYERVIRDLRCLVCRSESIADSNAPLARDLRVLVRERLTAGDSDTQTVGYIVQRYGNFVLLKPPVQVNTLLLWIGPLLLAVLAAFGFSRYLSRQAGMSSPTATETFTIEEEERLRSLLGKSAAATRTP